MNELPLPCNWNIYMEQIVVLERNVVYGAKDCARFVVQKIGINSGIINN